MEKFQIDNDIEVICIKADSFPDGVKGAHGKLHRLIPFTPERKYFGISWAGEDGAIHYQAAVDILNPEEEKLPGTTPFTIRKGTYMSIRIKDYMSDLQSIGRAFNELLTLETTDPNGYCLEWYMSELEVRCMVPMKEMVNSK